MQDTLIWVGVGAALLTGVWAGYTSLYEGSLDAPSYQVLTREGAFELRQYDPFVIASTPRQKPQARGSNTGFRVLAGYIFGGNQPGERMPMTAPVVMARDGESLGMTVPVVTDGSKGSMAFVMPRGRTLEDLPTPRSNAVRLGDVNWGRSATLRYNGYATPERFAAQTAKLQRWMKAKGYQARGTPLSAQYNSPSAMPLLRRNEVIIPLVESAPDQTP